MELMTIFESIILGIIEGVTEFLPISSTGHLILGGKILGIPETEFLKSFEIIIQLGAIAAVLFLFWKSFWQIENLKKVILGSIPTMIIGFALYKFVKNNLLGSSSVVLWAMLIGGIALIIFEFIYEKRSLSQKSSDDITYKQSFFIGVFQSLAVIPGVSRSAATIIGGLALGISRAAIAKFSFFLAIPVLLGASLLDISSAGTESFRGHIDTLLVGFVVAFLVAMLAIKFLMRYVQTKNFIPFGIYRVLAAIVFFLVIF